MAFKYAQPVEDPEEPLIDLNDDANDDSPLEPPKSVELSSPNSTQNSSVTTSSSSAEKDKHNAALDPSHPTYITPSTFRMIILADETYECFFHTQFWKSFQVDQKIDQDLGVVKNIRGMFNNFLADGRRVAIEVRKRMDDATKNIPDNANNIINNAMNGVGANNDKDGRSRAQTLSSNNDDDDDFGNFVTPANANDVLGDVPVGADFTSVLHDKKEIEKENELARQLKDTRLG
ncbi:unnamed protein product [Ambrosiozyma monospora]|uniref:Unnamed protein product n=1 Tax=Ambrosiozyma monospora TaxID=43982 RepID=A0ACB5T056_AMBMO|nr:unnamed protein product [Ambrosiozyma monospora]